MTTDLTDHPRTPAELLVDSAQFKHLLQGFSRTSGVDLHVYDTSGIPQTVPFDPPKFCEELQAGGECPLYFDPKYHRARGPEVRQTCAGLGHAVIPVLDAGGRQVLNLVSAPVRLGPVDMERITQLAFKLKVFPDELAAHAEAVPLVSRDRLQFASQVLFSGLHELASGQSARANLLTMLTRHVASAEPADVADAILASVMEFTTADFAHLVLANPETGEVVDQGTGTPGDPVPDAVLSGLAHWVLHAEQPIDIPDASASAWSRHLAGGELPAAALVAVPLSSNDTVFGSLVIGGLDTGMAADWIAGLTVFADVGGDALLLARRLVESGGGAMVDRRTGAYNSAFLEELLEKEISRAGRHHHELSLVLFHTENYLELIKHLGAAGADEVLGQLVNLLKSKTRKVNSLARINEADFCLVIPEADRAVAEKIAVELATLAHSAPFSVDVDGGRAQIKLSLQTRTVSNPRGVDAALQALEPSLN